MLRQRVATALVLLALLLPALFAPVAWPLQAFTLLLVAAAGWEWGRLNGVAFAPALAGGAAIAAAGAAAIALGWADRVPGMGWWLPAAAWIVCGTLALAAGPQAWRHAPRLPRWSLGALLLWSAWLAMAQARALGLPFLLSIFVLVWMADIAAYAGGRAFGRRKLAPTISPGKSWEGAASGALGVALLALAWSWAARHWPWAHGSLFERLHEVLGAAGAALALGALVAMSVVGDLVESLVKRAVGAKDSSRLLPGHGGVLDRIDALLPVFPLAAALAALGRA
ncbi:MAG: phosphatidate cytidylyltransferase [Burkholderiales bacterium]|nr:phosphatidate cytidylyltransferase [Burkholderiales bacterium]